MKTILGFVLNAIKTFTSEIYLIVGDMKENQKLKYIQLIYRIEILLYILYLYILTNELNHILELKNTGVPEISLFNKRFLKKNKFSYPEFKFSWCN